MAGDCVLVYLTDIKINTQKFEMLSEKMTKTYELLLIFFNMTALISKPAYILSQYQASFYNRFPIILM
jgi:hypothetical protein